jgi:membrane associated rhomboid family serine protease
MRSAPVGHQCVECVEQSARSVPQPTTAFGGRAAGKPLVTYVLIALNVVMYVLQQANDVVYQQLVLWPWGIAHGDEFYRLVTSGFLHAGVAHILFNMVALYFTGPALERALGPARFIGLYALSLLGGSVLVYLLSPVETPTLGASGAIFGLFGATFVLARKLHFDVRGIVGLIVINLAITFIAPGISWQGHVGGLGGGVGLRLRSASEPDADRDGVLARVAAAVRGAHLVAHRGHRHGRRRLTLGAGRCAAAVPDVGQRLPDAGQVGLGVRMSRHVPLHLLADLLP